MDFQVGGNHFLGAMIPLLWGTRAVVRDREKRLSVIDLGGEVARIEILGGKPAIGVEFTPTVGGFQILRGGLPLYEFLGREGRLSSITLNLPDCAVTDDGVRVDSNLFQDNMLRGFEVGIRVDEDGIALGARLPRGLARLAV